jgi:uncharacterized protein YjiS (DUF1127 family)
MSAKPPVRRIQTGMFTMTALDVAAYASPAPACGNILDIWRARIRFRQELWRLQRDKPELLADIGLTTELVRTECAKRFWQPSLTLPGRARVS